MAQKKNYNIKIFTLAGVYVRTLAPSVVMSGVSFTSQINGGQGEARIQLAIPFATSLIGYNNVIRIYESDDANLNGRLIYTGIVGNLSRSNDKGAEYIEVRAIGIASMLSWIYYDAAGSYAFSKNQDPSLTIKDIVDRFSIKYPNLITYTGSTVETSGTTANLSFSYDKAGDAVKKAVATTQWWWTVDGSGKLQFHPRTGAVGQIHHKLDLGTDVDTIQVEEITEKLVNKYVLEYTGGTVTSQDTTSQTTHGIRELKDSKTDITNSTTAQAAADAYIAKNKNPTRRVTLTVNTKFYDIESVRPGDLVTVRNIDIDISSLQISKIEYNPDNIKISLEDLNSFANEIFTL